MAKGNKNSATEDEVGLLHKGITRAFTRKVQMMNDRFDIASEDEDEAGMLLAIDTRDLAAAAKWVSMNEITHAEPENEENNELARKLKETQDKQKNNILKFVDNA